MLSVTTFTSIINQLLPEPHAGLLNGILFGTKATLSKDFLDALITTGTLHIVALSGMNISILASIISTSLLRVFSRRIASLLTVGSIIGFVWFVGPSASVIRAAIMGCITLLAVVFGRQTWGLYSLFIAGGIMLMIHPAWIGDLSFQLSFLATLGIILFGGATEVASSSLRGVSDEAISKISERSPRFGIHRTLAMTMHSLYSFLENDLRTTLAAQAFTIPLILLTFQRISLVSPLTNILIGWIIPPLTVLGMGTAIAGYIFLPLGQLFAWFAWVLLHYLILVIELTSRLPFASIGR